MSQTAMQISVFEGNLAGLSDIVEDCRNHEMFDAADHLEETILLMKMLAPLAREFFSPDEVADDQPVTGDMTVLRDMAIRMKELQSVATDLKAKAGENKVLLDELRLRKIPDMMEALQVKTATFSGVGRVQTATDLYASTRKGQKPAAMTWLRDCGYENMIVETYNASSLKALFRRQLENGVDIPDDIFSVVPFVRASVVKA